MKPVILVVDDEPANLKLVSRILLWEGYQVLSAASAEEALDIVRETPPDLALIDVELPKMDGLSLVRLLRESEGTTHLPVIALSAHAMKEEIDRAAAAGCDAYITKPIDTRKFCEQIAQHLRTGACS